MAITLPQAVPLGGGVTLYRGTFSHTAGAAFETFALGSARVSSLTVSSQDSGGRQEVATFSESVSGNTNTVTVNWAAPVTNGRIEVTAFAGG